MANSEEEKPAFYVENSKITLIDCEIEGFKTPFEVRGDSTVSGSGTRILPEQQSKCGGGSGFWAVVVGCLGRDRRCTASLDGVDVGAG